MRCTSARQMAILSSFIVIGLSSVALGFLFWARLSMHASAGPQPAVEPDIVRPERVRSLVPLAATPLDLGQLTNVEDFAKASKHKIAAGLSESAESASYQSDPTVELWRGWERVLQEQDAQSVHQREPVDRCELYRFMGLIEGITSTVPSLRWAQTFLTASVDPGLFVSFSKSPSDAPSELASRCTVKPLGNERWLLRVGEESWELPPNRLKTTMPNSIEIVEAGPVLFAAMLSWPPTPYTLYMLDRSSHSVKWSTDVWAAGDTLSYTGYGWHFADLSILGETVVVLGAAGNTVYVEVFDRQSGECKVRFSTIYVSLYR